MTQSRVLAALSVCLTVAPLALAQAGRTTVGTLSLFRQVEATTLPAGSGDPIYRSVRDGESVFSGQEIRTLKRSGAEIKLKGTTVRLRERSEVSITESSLVLRQGAVWVDATSTPFAISCGGATISVASGTVTVQAISAERSRITCLRGSAEVESRGQKQRLKAGESLSVRISPTLIALGVAEEIVANQRPDELGGPVRGWWHEIETERGLLVTPGSSAGFAIRSSALNEAIAAVAGIPPSPAAIASNAAKKARLLSIAQNAVVPTVERELATNPTLTLAGYRSKFSTDDIGSRYALSSSDLTFLKENGIGSVGQFFTALDATGASFGLEVRSVAAPSRVVYRPISVTGASSKFSLFDNTESSDSYLLLGALATGALDGRAGKLTLPTGSASVYGFTSDPQAIGARGELTGVVGKTRYTWESNAARILSGDASQTFSKPASVFSFEREFGDGVTAFIGRKRFYAGPTLLNLSRAQLVGDRYTGVGARVRRAEWTAEAAFLHDANPDVNGAQAGFLATASRRVNGGVVGVQTIRVPKLAGGTGFTVSGSYPVDPGSVDAYVELGRGPDKASLATIGAYFPRIYQSSDLDVFAELSNHSGVGNTFTVTASRSLLVGATIRAYVGTGKYAFESKSNTFGGLGLSYRLSL